SLVVEDLPSFYLLDVVRAFALERASDELKQRFVTWAAGRAERALGLVYADPPESMRALVEETPAYVEAAAHASSAEEVAWLALAIRAHDLLHGRPERSTELLEALDLDELPSRLRIDLMNVRWALQASAAPSEALLPLAERALAAARREGTTEQIVESWTRVLTNKMWRSGASEVVQECTDLISFSRANRVPELLLGSALWLKATVTERLQDYDTALAEMEEAAHLLEARTDLHSMAVVSLCVIHRLMGRPERHAALAERAYRQATKTKIASAILTTGFSAALAATELDDVRRASEIFGSIQPIAHELGDITRIFRIELGLTELTEDPLQARQRLRAIRLRARTEGRPIMEATALAQLGRRLHEAHSIERALAAYAEALSILESTDLQLDRTVTNTWYTLALCADGQSDAAREALKRCTARAGLGKLVADLGRARISGHPLPPHTRRSRTLRHTRTLPVTQD
nr:hypothetical protein [Myxococcales bacterium]